MTDQDAFLARVSISVTQHHDWKQFGEESVYFTYTSSKMPYVLAYSPVSWRHLLSGGSLLSNDSNLCQTDTKQDGTGMEILICRTYCPCVDGDDLYFTKGVLLTVFPPAMPLFKSKYLFFFQSVGLKISYCDCINGKSSASFSRKVIWREMNRKGPSSPCECLARCEVWLDKVEVFAVHTLYCILFHCWGQLL